MRVLRCAGTKVPAPHQCGKSWGRTFSSGQVAAPHLCGQVVGPDPEFGQVPRSTSLRKSWGRNFSSGRVPTRIETRAGARLAVSAGLKPCPTSRFRLELSLLAEPLRSAREL